MSTSSKVSFLLVLQFLSLAQGLTLPSLATADSVLTPNRSIHAIPATPPGVVINDMWDEQTHLGVMGTLEAVINLMYGLSTQEYEAQVDLSQLSYVAAYEDRVAIYTKAVSQQLQPRHIIVALYRAVLGMYRGQPGFYAYDSTIVLDGQPVGLLAIDYATPDGSSTTSTSLEIINPPAINGTSGARRTSGIVIDSEDFRLQIYWRANSTDIPAEDILASVMDGIADVAAFDTWTSCQPIIGTSLSGQVTFSVRGIDGTMLCGRISKTFRLIANEIIVISRIYKEIDLIVKYNDQRIGSGKIGFAQGNSRTAAEVETS